MTKQATDLQIEEIRILLDGIAETATLLGRALERYTDEDGEWPFIPSGQTLIDALYEVDDALGNLDGTE